MREIFDYRAKETSSVFNVNGERLVNDKNVAETKGKWAFVLPGIGKSVLVKRKARMGRNPTTGKEIKIPAKTFVKIHSCPK